jgi:hypothetical protein
VPLCRIRTTRLRPQTLAATLQVAAPTTPVPHRRLGDFPRIRRLHRKSKGGKKELGEGRRRGRRGRSWGPLWCVGCDAVLEPLIRRA